MVQLKYLNVDFILSNSLFFLFSNLGIFINSNYTKITSSESYLICSEQHFKAMKQL